MSIRRWVLAGIAIVLACEPGPPWSIRRELARGRTHANHWIADADGTHVSQETAIALGYIERLRLGLGSPFRLAALALEDPRLTIQVRSDVAWAILARALDRDSYHVPAAALDDLTPPGVAGAGAGSGGLHLALIDATIRHADDPRIGEAAVRMAYTRAAAEGTIRIDALAAVAGAAALIRDRELTHGDVRRLLAAANSPDVDPLALLEAWRAQRRFMVEMPPLRWASADADRRTRAAADEVRRHLHAIESGKHSAPADSEDRPLPGLTAAHVLASVVDSMAPPPQAAVAVVVAAHRKDLLSPGLDPRTRMARERFAQNAVSEEAFAAGFPGLVRAAGPEIAGRIALSVAVAMRGLAQEPVWFPGFPAPTTDQLEAAWGLEIGFAADVPETWRSYTLRMVDLALIDLRRVLPDLDLDGLGISVTRTAPGEGVLALHDPRRRRLTLPAGSAAGTLAHEIAHDLDWQLALRRYGIRGDYASDGAALAAGDPLGRRLEALARAPVAETACSSGGLVEYPAAGVRRSAAPRSPDHARRPAEVFARSVEWFVAASLAGLGRSNGYLTSIQDELLAGYGSARPPDVSGIAGAALVDVLDEVAPPGPGFRSMFLSRYGPRPRVLSPREQARHELALRGSDCRI